MYKAPAYSSYPFLMLTDPYLPSGSVSPSVSYTLTCFSFTMNAARPLVIFNGLFGSRGKKFTDVLRIRSHINLKFNLKRKSVGFWPYCADARRRLVPSTFLEEKKELPIELL